MPKKTKTQKSNSNVINSISRVSGDIDSLSSQIAKLADAFISERDLGASKIKSERELLSRRAALQNLKEESDDLRSERRKNQDKLERLLGEQQKETETDQEAKSKRGTKYSDAATKSFEGGQFLSGMIFKFLGRNEKDKKRIDADQKADRQKQIEELRAKSGALSDQSKTLRDTRNSIVSLNANIVEIEEERKYEQRDVEKTAVVEKLFDVNVIDFGPTAVSKLKNLLNSLNFGAGGGVSLPGLGGGGLLSKAWQGTKAVGRFVGKAAPWIAGGVAAVDAYKGATDDDTIRDTLGKSSTDFISMMDRFKSAVASALSGVTAGIVPPKDIANKAEKLVGSQKPTDGVAAMPIEKINEVLDKNGPIRKAIEAKFKDPATAEAVKRIVYSESSGLNKKGELSPDYGYFQFNVGTSPSVAKAAGIELNAPEDVLKLSAEQQTEMYAEYIKGLTKANIPLTPENLKIYGFASGKGLQALQRQQSGDPEAGKSVIYPKGHKVFDHAHFRKMAEMDPDSGGDVTLKGMQQWIRSLPDFKTKAIPTPSKITPTAPLRFKDANSDLSDTQLQKLYPTLYKEMLNEFQLEMNKPENERQKLDETKTISPEARMRYRIMYEQKTGESSSVPGLSYRQLKDRITNVDPPTPAVTTPAAPERTTQDSTPAVPQKPSPFSTAATMMPPTIPNDLYPAAAINKDIQSQQQSGDVTMALSQVFNSTQGKGPFQVRERPKAAYPGDSTTTANPRVQLT